ncbi:MAG: NUDIX domain-containing protein [Fibrobacteres bacterium]|nr:NUDIX domain-containing protein [Fibrobacterota bacterium]
MLNDTGFKFCPRCAYSSISEKEGKALLCASCGFLFYYNPAAACGCIIDTPDGVLLIKRARDPGKGTLDVPGGFCDFDEALEDAVRREVKEEINLTLDNLKYFASFPNIYVYKSVTYHTLDAFFTASVSDLSTLALENEVAGYEFVSAEKYDGAKIGFPSVKRVLDRYFGKS